MELKSLELKLPQSIMGRITVAAMIGGLVTAALISAIIFSVAMTKDYSIGPVRDSKAFTERSSDRGNGDTMDGSFILVSFSEHRGDVSSDLKANNNRQVQDRVSGAVPCPLITTPSFTKTQLIRVPDSNTGLECPLNDRQ